MDGSKYHCSAGLLPDQEQIRFPPSFSKELVARARAEGLAVHRSLYDHGARQESDVLQKGACDATYVRLAT